MMLRDTRKLLPTLGGVTVLIGLLTGASGELSPNDRSNTSRRLFDAAAARLLQGRADDAIEKYRAIVRSDRESTLAAEAQLRIAEILSSGRQYVEGFDAYQTVIDRFPASPLFSQALKGQLLLVERLIEQQQQLRARPNPERKRHLPEAATTIAMLRAVISNGKFTAQAPEAQYQLAVALDAEKQFAEAQREHSLFLHNYPDHPLADDAAFQIGMIHYRRGRESNNERSALEQARLALEFFITAHPNSEKRPEAAHMLATIGQSEYQTLREVGEFYNRSGKTAAALKVQRAADAVISQGTNQRRPEQPVAVLSRHDEAADRSNEILEPVAEARPSLPEPAEGPIVQTRPSGPHDDSIRATDDDDVLGPPVLGN